MRKSARVPCGKQLILWLCEEGFGFPQIIDSLFTPSEQGTGIITG